MGVRGVGEREGDGAAPDLRRLLLRADDSEGAKARALKQLLQGDVFAATWPNATDAVRTLKSGDGEQAMPLFTGMDVLRAVAERFGWMDVDGSICSRTFYARDALGGALAQGVGFVVVDIGAEHSVEFSRDEIAMALSATLAPPRRISKSPRGLRSVSPATKPSPVPSNRSSAQALLGEIDMPFADRTCVKTAQVVVREEVAKSSGRRRHDPRTEPEMAIFRPDAQPTSSDRSADAVSAIEAATVADAASAQRAAQDLAALLKDRAKQAVREEAKPGAAQAAAKALAGVLCAGADTQLPESSSVAAIDEIEVEVAVSDASPTVLPVLPELPPAVQSSATLRRLDPGLNEELLSLIADALRKYPEVEWACEVSDGSPVPVVAIRFAASFLGHVDEIRAAIGALARARDMTVAVLVLTDDQQTRQARSHGNLFFPWQKRGAKR